MLRKLALLSSLGLAIGCVVVSDDTADTGNNDSPGTGNDDVDDNSDVPATDDNNDPGTDDNTDPADTAASDDDVSTDDTPADGTAEDTGTVSLCGWGPIEEKKITEGYICGGDGVDPNGNFPIECPDIELSIGDRCGNITGEGCCAGDVVWFCSNPNDGNPNTLGSQDCAG